MHEETCFPGGVFSESIDGGRAGADIELAHDGVSAFTKQGERFFLRYSECNVEIGGFNGRMVFCRNADRSLTIFCDHKRFAAALAYASGGLLDDQLNQKQRILKSQVRKGRSFALVAILVAGLLVVGLYYGIRAAGVAAVKAVPISVDRQIGRHSYASMDLGGKEIHDEIIVGAMQNIVDRLSPHAALEGLEFEVHVVKSPEVNAFALPGGVIVVYTGLIEQAERPEQVAGVISHEIAHATLRHGLQRISQSLGLAAAVNLLIGDVQGIVVLGSQLFQLASINSYSRDQENDADAEGVRMLHAAAIDPLSLAQFFEVLKQQDDGIPGGLGWISTHPEHDARIIRIREQMSALPPQQYLPLDFDWDEVRRRIEGE